MLKIKKKYKSKILVFLVTIVSLTGLGFTATPASADSNLKLAPTNYTYTGVSPNSGDRVSDTIWRMTMDGKTAFCVESGIFTNDGGGYIGSTYLHSKKELLSQIVYHGYTNTNQSDYNLAITQVMVWEVLGDKYISSTIPDYHDKKAEIMKKVNAHKTLPSWHNQEFTIEAGKSITINDSNQVFSGMSLSNNTTSTTLSKSGNSLSISADKNSKNGTISYQKFSSSDVGASIVYKKPDKQTLVEFHLDSTINTQLKLKVIHFGDLQLQKIDETTNKPLGNVTFRLEYDGITKELVTNDKGIIKLEHIKEGTKVTVTEVKAHDGYYNKGEIKTFTI